MSILIITCQEQISDQQMDRWLMSPYPFALVTPNTRYGPVEKSDSLRGLHFNAKVATRLAVPASSEIVDTYKNNLPFYAENNYQYIPLLATDSTMTAMRRNYATSTQGKSFVPTRALERFSISSRPNPSSCSIRHRPSK